MSGVAATAFAIFAAIALGLAFGCSRWARAAQAEDAEAVLRKEIDRLEK